MVTVGRPEPRAMGLGWPRMNERRNQGLLTAGRGADRPALARASSRTLRSASSFCL